MTNPLYEPVATALEEAPFDLSIFGHQVREAVIAELREAGERGDDPRTAMTDLAVLSGALVVGLNMVAHGGALCSNCIGGSLFAIAEAIVRQKDAQDEYAGTHQEKH